MHRQKLPGHCGNGYHLGVEVENGSLHDEFPFNWGNFSTSMIMEGRVPSIKRTYVTPEGRHSQKRKGVHLPLHSQDRAMLVSG